MRSMIRASHGFAALAWSAALLAAATAQQAPSRRAAGAKQIERTERQRELDALLGDLQRSREQEARLKGEIDKIKNDRKKFSQDLLDTAARIRAAETKLGDAEKRLAPLDQREADLKKSLAGREAVLSQVLGALERLGLRPAPALLLQPETTLEVGALGDPAGRRDSGIARRGGDDRRRSFGTCAGAAGYRRRARFACRKPRGARGRSAPHFRPHRRTPAPAGRRRKSAGRRARPRPGAREAGRDRSRSREPHGARDRGRDTRRGGRRKREESADRRLARHPIPPAFRLRFPSSRPRESCLYP